MRDGYLLSYVMFYIIKSNVIFRVMCFFDLCFYFDAELVACQIPLSIFSIFPNTIMAKLLVWLVFKYKKSNKYKPIFLCFLFLVAYLFFTFCMLFILKNLKKKKKKKKMLKAKTKKSINNYMKLIMKTILN